MSISRRSFSLSLAATTLLAGCSGSAPGSSGTTARSAPNRPKAVPSPAFDAWVAAFRARALARGITPGSFDRAFRGAGFLPDVLEKDGNQFQTRRSLEDYVALATSDSRLSEGRKNFARYKSVLTAISARYNVDPAVVTAIWGIESRYGQRRGEHPVISALASLGYGSRRAGFFESQLVAALQILQQGNTTPENMVGSWAGAMGHTQFIPTTYLAYAVDFTGDGRRDIWAEDPTDALASAAHYISRSGWNPGLPWGVEVRLPDGMTAPASYKSAPRRAFSDWAAAGVRRAGGGSLPASGTAGLIRPAGIGPALLITSNFNTLLRYNNSDKYVIAVGHLSDRLKGAGPFAASFGPDATGLTLAQRKELQTRLNRKGFDVGTVDGVLGKQTEAAIEAFQKKSGLPVTGSPSPALLAQLR